MGILKDFLVIVSAVQRQNVYRTGLRKNIAPKERNVSFAHKWGEEK